MILLKKFYRTYPVQMYKYWYFWSFWSYASLTVFISKTVRFLIWSPHMLCGLCFIFQACRICHFFFLADLASQADKTILHSLLLAPLIPPSVSSLYSRVSFLIPLFHSPWVFLSWCVCFLCLLHNSIFIDEKWLPWSSAYLSGHFVKSLSKQKKLKRR